MSTQCTTPNCVNLTESLRSDNRNGQQAKSSHGVRGASNLIGHWLGMIKGFVVKHCEQHLDRMAFQHLLKLDDHMLKDIGITRADVLYANNLPLAEDAAKHVNGIARRNILNQRYKQ